MTSEQLSYKDSGVDIDEKNKTFSKINQFVSTRNSRVLNSMGAFASLIDIKFPEYDHPVLTFKLEEPGTKQKLALQYGSLSSVAHDMINHLVNDIIVMCSKPLAVQDLIVCGKLKDEIITPLVKAMKDACDHNECSLVGGETSEQPGVISEETHILGASIIGVSEKADIIDGSKISIGDMVVAFSSNGLHTNGYSLVRKLIEQKPEIVNQVVAGEKFIDIVLRPHYAYYPMLKSVLFEKFIHGLAHITGGGIAGNLCRIIPDGLSAQIDLGLVRILPVFKFIKEQAGSVDADLLRTFNLGVGLIAVIKPEDYARLAALKNSEIEIYQLGQIIKNPAEKITFKSELNWK